MDLPPGEWGCLDDSVDEHVRKHCAYEFDQKADAQPTVHGDPFGAFAARCIEISRRPSTAARPCRGRPAACMGPLSGFCAPRSNLDVAARAEL